MIKYCTIVFVLCCMAMITSLYGENRDVIRIKFNNPDLIVDLGVGLWGTPIPVDYDNDGLMDIVMSSPDTPFEGLYFFKNIGSIKNPLFDVPVRLSGKAFQNMQASYIAGILYVISQGKEFQNFKEELYNKPLNINVDRNPRNDLKSVRSDMWSYVDYDKDGDADILVGIDTWADYGWDNAYDSDGNWTKGPLRGYLYLLENKDGNFINKGRIKAQGKDIESYGAPGANMADFNGDGKPDIICGEFLDKLTFYQNTGNRNNPKFANGRILLDEHGDTIRLHVQMITPVAVDFDGDGNVDLIVGDEDGRVAFIKNTGKTRKQISIFHNPVYLKQKADNLKFGALATPYSVDWDGDGKEDIISGNSAGNICFIKNSDGAFPPKWDAPVSLKAGGKEIRIMAGKNGSIQGPAEAKWGYTTLSVADWDNDGKKDIVVNSIFGKIIWYKNTGDLTNLEGPYPVKVDWGESETPKPAWNWWNPGKTDLVTQWRTTPIAVDWNKDGLTDLIVLDRDGYLSWFERVKKDRELWLKPGRRVFYAADISKYKANNKIAGGNPSPLQLNVEQGGRSGRRKICLVDWNNDGRLDLVVNSVNVCLFENIEQRGDTAFFVNRGDLSRVKLAGHDTSPAAVDWNNDGIYDIMIGGEDGHFYWIRNNQNK